MTVHLGNEANGPVDRDTKIEEAGAVAEQRSVVDDTALEETNGTPSPRYRIAQKVYARDMDGVLYLAVIRRQLYGPHYHRQVEMGLVSSMEEADEMLDDKNDMVPSWHYFVHFNKWNVKFDRWVSEGDVFEVTEETTAYATRISTEHRALHLQMRKHTSKKKASQTVDGAAFLREWKKCIVSIDNEFNIRPDQQTKKDLAPTSDETSVPPPVTIAPSPSKSKKSAYWTKKRLVAECKLREQGLTEQRPSNISNSIILPFALKKVIVQQWEIINQCKMVSCLPAPTTIRQVLDMYLESKNVFKRSKATSHTNSDDVSDAVEAKKLPAAVEPPLTVDAEASASTSIELETDKVQPNGTETSTDETNREEEWNTMADGIAMLFDEVLPSQLLYDEELVQHCVLPSHLPECVNRPDSEIYGCEHLVRLFVKLPEMLDSALDAEATRPLIAKVNDFIRFLDKNHGTVFSQSHRKLNELELKEQQKRLKLDDKKRSAPQSSSPAVESAKKKAKKTNQL